MSRKLLTFQLFWRYVISRRLDIAIVNSINYYNNIWNVDTSDLIGPPSNEVQCQPKFIDVAIYAINDYLFDGSMDTGYINLINPNECTPDAEAGETLDHMRIRYTTAWDVHKVLINIYLIKSTHFYINRIKEGNML